ncbi:hypothetical protein J3Q64DRAFT_1692448 [Phycomyces blakesleeanus]|uniref:Uncharacterized protein n=1 Tax=Phycomyces blakesleeanus TaxID=4837 RepID=A0ABR3BDM0_PHYBL
MLPSYLIDIFFGRLNITLWHKGILCRLSGRFVPRRAYVSLFWTYKRERTNDLLYCVLRSLLSYLTGSFLRKCPDELVVIMRNVFSDRISFLYSGPTRENARMISCTVFYGRYCRISLAVFCTSVQTSWLWQCAMRCGNR